MPSRSVPYLGDAQQGQANLELPNWSHSVEYPPGSGNDFDYVMVGEDPFTAQADATSAIQTPVVGVKLAFQDSGGNTVATLDASSADPVCGQTQSSVQSALSSPIFQDDTATSDGSNTQYLDAFQRENFYDQTKPGGTNPSYHVLLNGTAAPVLTIDVPPDEGSAVPGRSCGTTSVLEGLVDDTWLQSQLQQAIATSTTPGESPSGLPIFLLYNTVACQDFSSQTNCGFEGEHIATTSSPIQTYVWSDYQTSTGAGGTNQNPDVEGLSHEVAEWMDDPLGDNLVPTWGNVGQDAPQGSTPATCQPNLEPGDPLTGTLDSIDGYHVQDLAFTSWFYRTSSTAPSGDYSFLGNFSQPSDATVCPAQPLSVTATAGDGQVTASWTEPGPPDFGPVDAFLVCADEPGTPLINPDGSYAICQGPVAEADAGTTSATVTGLTDGTAYVLRVIAFHQSGTDVNGNPTLVASTPSFASAPVTPQATSATTTTVASTSTSTSTVVGLTYQPGSSQSATETVSSSQLAFTGPGTGIKITAVLGAGLILIGLALFVVVESPRQALSRLAHVQPKWTVSASAARSVVTRAAAERGRWMLGR